MSIVDKIEQKLILRKLKSESGSHSPSTKEIVSKLGFNPIKHDFCFLSNPYATDLVVERLSSLFSDKREVFNLLEAYPAGSRYVAENISKFEGVDSSKIVVANGAVQAIEWVCEGWGLERLLIPIPTFSTYYEFLGDKCVLLEDFWLKDEISASHLLNLADENSSDSILLILPNNPTGETLPLDELKKLIENLGDRKLIIDESFSHFISDYESYAEFRNELTNEKIVFIKSMSKDFGVAGLRLGYLYTFDKKLLDFSNRKTTWNLNNFSVTFSDYLAEEGFRSEYLNARSRYLEAKDEFFDKLCTIDGLKVFPSEANFFLIQFERNKYPDIVYDLLINYGIYVRTMEDKIGLDDGYIRVASRRVEENNFFLDSIKEYLGND
mgnify:CR=1 FL=1